MDREGEIGAESVGASEGQLELRSMAAKEGIKKTTCEEEKKRRYGEG